ncbi:hypothetical protein QYF61_018181 [Mycteria americana]|uniref:Uncharacterized protein n=1 Tax=Mycteria americana TaxID=33587 RepID=A0AAN7NK21_MYCAM|nr:hypothetical protein QYF61_018181 [Mycteria americana]
MQIAPHLATIGLACTTTFTSGMGSVSCSVEPGPCTLRDCTRFHGCSSRGTVHGPWDNVFDITFACLDNRKYVQKATQSGKACDVLVLLRKVYQESYSLAVVPPPSCNNTATSPTTEQRDVVRFKAYSWKRPLRSSSPAINLTLPSPPLNHVPKSHIYTSFKYLQG